MSLDLTDWQNKKYQTRDGRPMRLLCTDAPGCLSIKGIDSYGNLSEWAIDGYSATSFRAWDLINAPPEPVTITRFVNVYRQPEESPQKYSTGPTHYNEELARLEAKLSVKTLAAAVPVTITFTPGGSQS